MILAPWRGKEGKVCEKCSGMTIKVPHKRTRILVCAFPIVPQHRESILFPLTFVSKPTFKIKCTFLQRSRGGSKKKPAELTVSYQISDSDLVSLKKEEMLTDHHINSVVALMKQTFPEVEGLQNTLNYQRKENAFKTVSDGSIQVFYCGDREKHWVTTCSMDNQVYLCDSLPRERVSDDLQSQIRAVYGQSTHAVVVPYVQKQKNRVDCECFSIAWALHLALGEKPEEILLNTKCQCYHLMTILMEKKLTPFLHTMKKGRRTHSTIIHLAD